MNRLVLCTLLIAGCSSAPNPLEARVHALEGEVAELRATLTQVKARPAEATEAQRARDAMQLLQQNCKDVSIPEGTTIDVPVAFDLGVSTTVPGDRITIKEVRGTRSDFALGGVYLVRGEYTLASADEATLALGVGATDPHNACTMGNTRGRQHVMRGSGTFELATTFVHRGYPGISFFPAGGNAPLRGAGGGGLRFGKGEFPAQ